MMRHPVLAAAALALAVGLSGCGHPDQADLAQLQRFGDAPPATIAAETIACNATDPACVRLWLHKGAACSQLTEAASAAERASMRQCAVDAFLQARALCAKDPANPDLLAATKGLANALKVARDNEHDAAAHQQDVAALGALLPDLAALPGGAPYAGYFEADALTNAVLTDETTGSAVCPALGDAKAKLPAGPLPEDLRQRVPQLGAIIDGQRHNRSCS